MPSTTMAPVVPVAPITPTLIAIVAKEDSVVRVAKVGNQVKGDLQSLLGLNLLK